MSNYYGGGSSGGGFYGSSSGSGTKKKGGGSLLNKIFDNPVVQVGENLLDDVKDTVVGIPTGLVMLAKDPIRTGKAVGAGMWHDYSPLFSGDFKKFGKQVYDHPLGPILDILSVATLGAGAAAKGAGALSKAGASGRIIDKLADPKLTRTLRSGHADNMAAVVEHTKGYSYNPFIRARQVTMEKAVNGMAGLLPSFFQVDKVLPDEVIRGFNGAERADAWRWYRADKYDEASRRHATVAASNLAIAGVIGAAKRLHQNPSDAAHAFIPNIVNNLKEHAHVVKESDLPSALRREMTDAEIAKMDRAARKAFREQQEAARKASAGTEVVKFDPAVARAGKVQDDVVDSYGVEITDVDVPNAETINERYVFVSKDAHTAAQDWLKRNPNVSSQELADFLASKGKYSEGRGLAGKLVTSDWRRAARNADGDFLVARNHSKYLEEAANSTHFLGQLGRNVTTAWKWAILGLRPAYLVNNAVGNYFMYFVSQGPSGIRGLMDALRQVRAPHGLTKDLSRAERQFFKASIDWQDKFYLGLHRGFSREAAEQLTGETVRIPIREMGGVKARFKRMAGANLYDVTHIVADRTLRRAAINNILRKHPEVQKLMRQGMHFDDAAQAVSESRAVREMVQQQVNDILGQYHYLNPTERALRAIVPFYTWDRAIVRHGAHLYLDRPTTAAAMTQLGEMGVEKTEELLGQIPDFLRGALPLAMIGLPEQVNGRVPILGTAGYNPYSSIESVIKSMQALSTGDVPTGEVFAGQLNPFLTAAIEQTTGQKLLSGARLPESATQGGLIPNILASVIGNLPQSKIADTAVTGPDGTPESLYPGNTLQFLYAYLGLPAKALNPRTAAEMAERRDGTASTGGKRGSGYYGG